jgi:hypothetical protein
VGEDYEVYEESLYFEGSFQGEPIISEALIHENGDIHFHQGPKIGDGEYRLDDIIGFGLEELKQVVEKAEEITDGDA